MKAIKVPKKKYFYKNLLTKFRDGTIIKIRGSETETHHKEKKVK